MLEPITRRLARPIPSFRPFRASLPRATLTTRPGLTNMLAGEVPPPVQVSSVTPAGIHLASGLLLPGPCIFLDGKVFLWDVPHTGVGQASSWFDGWGFERFEIFESVVPRPDLLVFGTGPSVRLLPPALRKHVNDLGIHLDIMDTRNACSTYNLLSEEGRRVAAALLPLAGHSWRPSQGHAREQKK